MARIIGIDLGTTNSCVAVVDAHRRGGTPNIRVIPNAEGARTTPSVVGFTRERRAARRASSRKRQAATNPEEHGRRGQAADGPQVRSPEVSGTARLCSVPDRRGATNGDAWVEVQGRRIGRRPRCRRSCSRR